MLLRTYTLQKLLDGLVSIKPLVFLPMYLCVCFSYLCCTTIYVNSLVDAAVTSKDEEATGQAADALLDYMDGEIPYHTVL